MGTSTRVQSDPSAEGYHKKSVFKLIDFKDIVISLLLTVFFFSIILGILFLDGFDPVRIAEALANPDSQTLSDVFGNAFGGMMVGVMALLITVVAFVVQMAANRYTTKIVDLFISNRVNLFYMTLTSVTTVYVIALLFLGNATKTMPRISLLAAFILVSLLLITIFPYFIFIFRFIKPSNIIYNIEKETFGNIRKSYRLGGNAAKAGLKAARLHANWLGGINQLTDITLNCIQNKDQILAIECIRSLRYLVMNYLRCQAARPLPESWLTPSVSVSMDVSFITLAEENIEKIEQSHFWVEDKILRQLEMIFRLSVNQDRTICNYIANSLYLLGCLVLELKNHAVLRKIIMYVNTFLRATINGEDLRTCFNTMNQYRKLAERLIEIQEDNVAIEIVRHFKYYGLLAKEMKGMDFILETAAHDLCDINRKAFAFGIRKREEILDIFLTVDMPIEGEKEVSLRGIRMAQLRLAAYYLAQEKDDAEQFARKIYTDMLDELHRPNGFERIFIMIRELSNSRKDFWEINDREYNFNYIPAEEKPFLRKLLDWFTLRLVILYAVEHTVNQNPGTAAHYLTDVKNVRKSLPAESGERVREPGQVSGGANLADKAAFDRQITALESVLADDSSLRAEILAQRDLGQTRILENLESVKKGIASFFKAFQTP